MKNPYLSGEATFCIIFFRPNEASVTELPWYHYLFYFPARAPVFALGLVMESLFIKVSATLKIAIFPYLRFQRFQIDMLENFQ